MLPLLDPDLVVIAESADGETIGVLICIPDAWQLGQATDRARLISIGVSPGWQGRRVAMSMGAQLTKTLIAKGYETVEGSWVMRDNHRPQLLAKLLGARPGREFALFSSDL
jgi:ribosomal protein S18 acetylase RimI-like enzyme